MFSEKSTEATVSGNSLIATFHKANPPLVWKFDLERNHSFTVALQGEEGDWELGLTSPKGDFYPITHFLTREDADDAFRCVNKALARHGSPLGFILKAAAVIILAGIVFLVIGTLLPPLLGMHKMPAGPGGRAPLSMQQLQQMQQQLQQMSKGLPGRGAEPSAATPEASEPAPEPSTEDMPMGVPVPADQVLRPPH
jgi:hypothetical protein